MLIALIEHAADARRSILAVGIAAEASRRGRDAIVVNFDKPDAHTWGDAVSRAGERAPISITLRADASATPQLQRFTRGDQLVFVACPPSRRDLLRATASLADRVLIVADPLSPDRGALIESLAVADACLALRAELRAYLAVIESCDGARLDASIEAILRRSCVQRLATSLRPGYRSDDPLGTPRAFASDASLEAAQHNARWLLDCLLATAAPRETAQRAPRTIVAEPVGQR